VKRYKFQALVTLDRPQQGGAPLPIGRMQRFVLRGEHHQTHDSQVFSALVSNNGEDSIPMAADHVVVTVMLIGDEPREYFSVGDHFALWRGRDVGHGVVTRRVFV
jgi:hypothetical protein